MAPLQSYLLIETNLNRFRRSAKFDPYSSGSTALCPQATLGYMSKAISCINLFNVIIIFLSYSINYYYSINNILVSLCEIEFISICVLNEYIDYRHYIKKYKIFCNICTKNNSIFILNVNLIPLYMPYFIRSSEKTQIF